MVPQAIATVASYILIGWLPPLFPFVAGFSAGSMLFVVLSDLIPRARGGLLDDSLALITVYSAVTFEVASTPYHACLFLFLICIVCARAVVLF
jgi:zinc transporter ZupT